ncbi:MAG: macrocin-O-methyltransferase [Clostridiaceae bacterium]|nr:macrocin-O-methyltransferase [Clostridiaceae bacterium]
MAEENFDGRINWKADDQIEGMLKKHFDKYDITPLEAAQNFTIYARRVQLKRFLAHYELFRQVVDLPGDIVELGVFRGTTLMEWANFMEIRNMGDRQKQVFGFDNFAGFTELSEKDGKADEAMNKQAGGFDSSAFEEILEDAISIYDADRFIPYKKRVELIKGNIEETIPKFVEEHPGLRISLIHFDCDMYLPTKIGLEYLYPLVVPGGIILFDEYGIRPWGGESNAVDEFFEGKGKEIHRFNWAPNPGGYIIK